MRHRFTRRQLLLAALPILPGSLLLRQRRASALEDGRSVLGYQLDLSILFNFLTLSLIGNVVQEIDRRAGRYRVTMDGKGTAISTRTEATGIIRDGRFKPLESRSVHLFRGRENTVATSYDYERQRVELHAVTHTLLLGRRRQVDDTLALPPGRHVDDLISAELNFAANTLDRDSDGTYSTWVMRRARADNEGPDDVSPDGYRAELVPLRFRPSPDGPTGRLIALVDITRFSSWARPDAPARVTFAPDRRLESVQSSLILGTTLSVRVTGNA
ncbi:MAG TPA: hypothetical protein VMC04_09135 [Verrucomicrobiae bacterium]|jgi:hypothetical protein|nr:hypothetical protein [Verrucomicrobiae bacterium]